MHWSYVFLALTHRYDLCALQFFGEIRSMCAGSLLITSLINESRWA